LKTKFSPIVKIRKNELEKIQKVISAINNNIAKKEEEILLFEQNYTNLETPISGNISELNVYNMQINIQRNKLKNLQLQLNGLILQKEETTELLRLANIEYEKIKYLEQEIIDEKLLFIKKQEDKEMDEIAIMLFDKNQ